MAETRIALHTWYAEEGVGTKLSPAKQVDVALSLIRETVAEDKLAGVLFLQEILLPLQAIKWWRDIPGFGALFKNGRIFDSNTCDWFCVKVLGPLAQQEGESCARAIAQWSRSKNLWQRRTSGVAFINLAEHGEANFLGFTDMLLEACADTVKSKERFAQTGTGWVLRELSLCEPKRVEHFLLNNLDDLSLEGLRYAPEKFPADLKARLIRRRKEHG